MSVRPAALRVTPSPGPRAAAVSGAAAELALAGATAAGAHATQPTGAALMRSGAVVVDEVPSFVGAGTARSSR